uniref:Osteoclast-stimulating factor 1 n=1 Tax=Strigops habroptila TaxID=2489341 RepID=A0A672UPB6_STRHB
MSWPISFRTCAAGLSVLIRIIIFRGIAQFCSASSFKERNLFGFEGCMYMLCLEGIILILVLFVTFLGQVKVFRALYTFEPRTPDELYFEEGDIIYISDMSDTNWWKGTCKGRTGLIPSNYVAEQAESIDNPLHEAAKRGNLSWLRECLDNQVGVNGLDKAGNTALYWACHGGHKDIVDVLFTQANLELNQQNKLGDTALHAAAWKGYADIVEMLLAKGARTDLKNNEKKLALDMATNATCASLLKKKQSAGTVRTLSNAEEYLDDEDSD